MDHVKWVKALPVRMQFVSKWLTSSKMFRWLYQMNKRRKFSFIGQEIKENFTWITKMLLIFAMIYWQNMA